MNIKDWAKQLANRINQPHYVESILLKAFRAGGVAAQKKEVEKIICSAIWYKDLPTPVFNPKNIDKGIVFCGHRHVQCLHQMCAMTGKKQHEAGEEIQGFLTNLNRFVDREEGAIIAIKSLQIDNLKYSQTELYSEDIY